MRCGRLSRLGPIVLLLAAMASPAIGRPRPLASLRLIVSIQWLSDDHADVETAAIDTPPTPLAPSPRVRLASAPDSRARQTALSPSSFQRPPPDLLSL